MERRRRGGKEGSLRRARGSHSAARDASSKGGSASLEWCITMFTVPRCWILCAPPLSNHFKPSSPPPPPPVYSLQPRGWRSLARGWNVDTCRVSCTSKFDRFKRVQKDDLIFKVAKIVSIKYMYRRRIKNSLL